MKLEDCFVGQSVGFKLDGEVVIGKVIELFTSKSILTGEDVNYAVVDDGSDSHLQLSVKRLLGVVK